MLITFTTHLAQQLCLGLLRVDLQRFHLSSCHGLNGLLPILLGLHAAATGVSAACRLQASRARQALQPHTDSAPLRFKQAAAMH